MSLPPASIGRTPSRRRGSVTWGSGGPRTHSDKVAQILSIMKQVSTTCPVCSGTTHTWLSANDLQYGIKGRWTALKCDVCRHGFQNPMPNEAELGRYYSDSYYAFQQPGNCFEPVGWKHPSVWTIMSYLKCFRGYKHLNVRRNPVLAMLGWYRGGPRWHVSPPFKSGGALLDYGCGSGQSVAFYRFLGWQAEGIEIDDRAVQRAKEANIPVERGSIDLLERRIDAYDWIVSWHCIEHVPDFWRLFRAFYAALKPGGRITIEVPNGDSLAAKRHGAYYFYLCLPVHTHLFSPSSIRRVGAAVGFTQIRVTTRTYCLTNQMKSSALLWRRRLGRPTDGGFGSQNRVEAALGWMSAWFTYIPSILLRGRGDCIFLEATKPAM